MEGMIKIKKKKTNIGTREDEVLCLGAEKIAEVLVFLFCFWCLDFVKVVREREWWMCGDL